MSEDLINALNSEMLWTNELIDKLTAELEKAPPGSLQIYKHQSNYQYYQTVPGKRTYISKKKSDLAMKLAQKEYDAAVLEQLLQLQEQMTALWHTLEGADLSEIINSFPAEKKKLINKCLMTDEEFIEEWINMPYKGKQIDDSAPELFSNKGEQVRSKSEKIIADKLFELGIPYRYEAPLLLGSMGIIYPDFTMLKVCTREDIYWEHLGMMDDALYCHKALNKVNQYIRNGYIPGKNLLLTFESKSIPINMRNVEIQLRTILKI